MILCVNSATKCTAGGAREMSPERWIAEFTAWLPTGSEFAERHAETIKSLESFRQCRN